MSRYQTLARGFARCSPSHSADFGADHAVGESPRRAGRRLPAGPGARDARPRPRGRRSRGQNRRLVTKPRRRPSAVAHAPAAPPAPRWETLGAAGSARSPPLLRSGRGAVSARHSADTPRRPCPRLRRGSGGSTKALATVEKARRIRSAQRRPAGRAATRASDSADPSPDSAAAAARATTSARPAARGAHTVLEQQVDARPRHQHGEPLQECRRLEPQMRRAVRPRMAHLQHDPPVGVH